MRCRAPEDAEVARVMQSCHRLLDQFRTLFRCRLCWRVTFAVFGAIFAIEAAILVPSYFAKERELLDRMSELCRAAVIGATVFRADEGPTGLTAVLGELASPGTLAGGAIYSVSGERLGVFGERPLHDLAELDSDGTGLVVGRRYEVVWPSAVTGLGVHIVGRINTAKVAGELRAFVWRVSGLVVLISVFVCIVTMIILSRAVLGPLLTMRDALGAARRDPANADRHVMEDTRSDEVGDVTAAVNNLLIRVSKTHREDLAAMVAMADSSEEGIVAYDAADEIAYANRALLEFCNARSTAEIAARGLPRFTVKDGGAPVMLQDLARDGEFSGEAELVSRDGAILPCYVNAGHIQDADGRLLRRYAMVTDISELRSAHRSLEEKNLELETSNRAKSEFVANMSHELRTPLNAVIGFSEMMLNEPFGPLGAEQYKEYTDDINNSGKHLLNIINDILDLSKIEAGRLELREEEFDPASAVESSIRLVSERAQSRNIRIGTEFVLPLPRLRGDGQKVKQILLNLLSNAVKFTPDGGEIVVSGLTESDGCLALAVSDNGVGIAEEDQAKVLLPFGQADSGLSRRYEGTGLGLPLAKAMVELHDGRLTLDSRPNHGTTVTLRFPPARLVA